MAHTMRKFPISDFTTPKDGLFQVYCDRWWVVTKDEEIFFFGTPQSPYGSPQCNLNMMIVDRHLNNQYILEAAEGPVEVRQLPVIYVPARISDYI